LCVLTDGPDGATAYRPGAEPLHRPGRAVRVVDTIGAGDAFTSGLLSGLLRRHRHLPGLLALLDDVALVDVLDEAILVSSLTCERTGADPPRLRRLPTAGDLPLAVADLAA